MTLIDDALDRADTDALAAAAGRAEKRSRGQPEGDASALAAWYVLAAVGNLVWMERHRREIAVDDAERQLEATSFDADLARFLDELDAGDT